MNILSVDTTTKNASVAIKTNDKVICDNISNEITHSEKLLPLIDASLKEADLNIKDIDKYFVLNGPGSFTGIRIGLASIKAFSMISKKEIFSISSLTLIALKEYLELNTEDEKHILSSIDARNNRIYYELFKVYKDKNTQKVLFESIINENNDDETIAIEHVIEKFSEINNDKVKELYFSGESIDKLKEIWINHANKTNNQINSIKINTASFYPDSKDLIEAYENLDDKIIHANTFDTYTLDARYVRKSQAERMKNGD